MFNVCTSLSEIKNVLLPEKNVTLLPFRRKPYPVTDRAVTKQVTNSDFNFATSDEILLPDEKDLQQNVTFVTSNSKMLPLKPLLRADGNKVTKVTKIFNNINLSSEDWLELFNERAAIFQFENGDDKTTAEAKAFDECIIKLLNLDKKQSLRTAVPYLMACGLHNPFYK